MSGERTRRQLVDTVTAGLYGLTGCSSSSSSSSSTHRRPVAEARVVDELREWTAPFELENSPARW